MRKAIFIFGTRPEAIKLAPLIKTFQQSEDFEVRTCITAQHREMLDQVLDFFEIQPDYDLNLMKADQSLLQLMASATVELERIMDEFPADIAFVQGDTSTVLVGALVAFYKKVKVVHIEAGLRSFDKHSPFPEEMNRLLTSRLADFHFTPTPSAEANLLKEGIEKEVYTVGNTVIDALKYTVDLVEKEGNIYKGRFNTIDFSRDIILVTCHRRESFGKPFEDICDALLELADQYPNFQFVYPVHLNPNIKEVANRRLKRDNIKLIAPLDYPNLVYLMNQSYLILTDSGGIQEEAPTLGKPVLVLREVTERMEGVEFGTAKLVGTDKNKIVREASTLIDNEVEYQKMANATNPYGDGNSSKAILEILSQANF